MWTVIFLTYFAFNFMVIKKYHFFGHDQNSTSGFWEIKKCGAAQFVLDWALLIWWRFTVQIGKHIQYDRVLKFGSKNKNVCRQNQMCRSAWYDTPLPGHLRKMLTNACSHNLHWNTWYSQAHKYWDIDTILIFLALYTTTMDLKWNEQDVLYVQTCSFNLRVFTSKAGERCRNYNSFYTVCASHFLRDQK